MRAKTLALVILVGLAGSNSWADDLPEANVVDDMERQAVIQASLADLRFELAKADTDMDRPKIKQLMTLLGQLRSTEAVGTLVEHMLFDPTSPPKSGPTISLRMELPPAVLALVAIGVDAVDELHLALIELPEGDRRIGYIAYVMGNAQDPQVAAESLAETAGDIPVVLSALESFARIYRGQIDVEVQTDSGPVLFDEYYGLPRPDPATVESEEILSELEDASENEERFALLVRRIAELLGPQAAADALAERASESLVFQRALENLERIHQGKFEVEVSTPYGPMVYGGNEYQESEAERGLHATHGGEERPSTGGLNSNRSSRHFTKQSGLPTSSGGAAFRKTDKRTEVGNSSSSDAQEGLSSEEEASSEVPSPLAAGELNLSTIWILAVSVCVLVVIVAFYLSRRRRPAA